MTWRTDTTHSRMGVEKGSAVPNTRLIGFSEWTKLAEYVAASERIGTLTTRQVQYLHDNHINLKIDLATARCLYLKWVRAAKRKKKSQALRNAMKGCAASHGHNIQ